MTSTTGASSQRAWRRTIATATGTPRNTPIDASMSSWTCCTSAEVHCSPQSEHKLVAKEANASPRASTNPPTSPTTESTVR